MKRNKNSEIRETLKRVGMFSYELAELLEIGEYTLCKKLRKELPVDEKSMLLDLINKNQKGVS